MNPCKCHTWTTNHRMPKTYLEYSPKCPDKAHARKARP